MKQITSFIFLLFWGIITAFSQDATFTAEAPRTVIQGSRFTVVYKVNTEATDLRVAELPDFHLLLGPSMATSQGMNMINGNVTRWVEYSYSYVYRADKLGTFTIPSASINVKGKRLESNRLSITVIAAEAGTGTGTGQGTQQQPARTQQPAEAGFTEEDLYITVTVNKSDVYQDEPILLTTRLYTRVGIENYSDFKLPDLKNYIVEELPLQGYVNFEKQNINGKIYDVGIFKQYVLYPQTTGRLTIEPTSVEFGVRQRQARQSHSIFDNFFDSYRTVKKRVYSKSVAINVKPLPTPRPSGFSGVVGDVNFSVTASKTDAKANDGITIKTTISGAGNLRFATNPQIKYPVDFDVFDPKVTNNITQTAQGGKGSRTIETLIIPRHAGSFEIPAVEYAYFNPSTERYHTLRSQPIIINVERGEGEEFSSTSGQSPGATTRENLKFLGTDIRFIKTSDIVLKPVNTFIVANPTFLLGYIVTIILFFLFFIINRKRIKENADILKVKTKKANKVARKRLKKSGEYLKKGNKEAFYEELSRAIWGYTSDKLSIPVSELSRDNAKAILIERGAEEELTEDFLSIIDTCEFARYAPQSDISERDNLYKKAINTISKLENTLK
ncbi:MAG: BatD family protein [Marinilabiliaceae bacterium]|nr:BatD family protein [Marinilabiliaceae bacterium]